MTQRTIVADLKRPKQQKKVAKDKPTAPQKPQKIKGICSNCKHNQDCLYLRNSRKPILFCQEYEVADEPRVHSRKTAGTTVKQAEPASSKPLKGLCVNCANRDTCTFRKPEGGVWHCEEYI